MLTADANNKGDLVVRIGSCDGRAAANAERLGPNRFVNSVSSPRRAHARRDAAAPLTRGSLPRCHSGQRLA